MDYKIISSCSEGNAVIIENNILIDCGVAFKHLKDYYNQFKIVLFTHIHNDHFNKATIKRLAREKPLLRFGCCEWLVEELVNIGVAKENIDIFQMGKEYDYNAFKLEVEYLYHDVPNCCYKVAINGKKMVYATDTKTLDHIKAKNYDLYLVEGNYETEKLEAKIKEKTEKGEFVYEHRVKETHMSKESVNDWLVKNMGDNSSFVYMHEHIERIN